MASRIAEAISGIDRVEKCLVRKMGYHYYVDRHVEVDLNMTVQRGHDIAHEVKDKVREKFSRVRDVLVHVEPTTQKLAGTRIKPRKREVLIRLTQASSQRSARGICGVEEQGGSN